MKTQQIIFAFITLATINTSFAAHSNELLQSKREQVTRRYIQDLQNADYKDITQLFEKNGTVISTSRGKVNAKEFFYSFLPEIVTAKTDIHQLFKNDANSNRLAVRFYFAFQLKNGEEGQGEYVDEFVFVDNSTQLSTVYMFENLKFEV